MLKPTHDRLLVRPIPDEFKEQLSSGLHLPETSREKPHRGVVLAVGPGYWHPRLRAIVASPWREGDIVIYDDDAGVEVEDDYETLLLLAEHEVLCGVLP